MTDHVNLPDSELHEPKGIKPLTGGSADSGKVLVSRGDGTSEVRRLSYSDIAENVAIVFVSSEADLPAPVGGVIDLGSGVTYNFIESFELNSRLTYGANVQLDGINSGTVILTYNGVQPLFTNALSDAGLRLDRFTINAPNAALFDVADATDSGSVRFESCTITCASFGVLNNLSILQTNQSRITLSTDGITLTGNTTNPIFNFINTQAFIAAGTFLDITAVVMGGARMQFAAIFETAAGVVGINSTGAANVSTGVSFIVRDVSLQVTTPLAGGLDNRALRWVFDDAPPLQDSQIGVATYLTTPETVIINSVGVYEQILGGNWDSGAINDALVTDANGISTYIGERPVALTITANLTVEKVGGGSDIVAVRIAKNGVTIAYSQGQTQNATPTQVTASAILELDTNDTFEVQVANNSTTANVIVDAANIVGSRVP